MIVTTPPVRPKSAARRKRKEKQSSPESDTSFTSRPTSIGGTPTSRGSMSRMGRRGPSMLSEIEQTNRERPAASMWISRKFYRVCSALNLNVVCGQCVVCVSPFYQDCGGGAAACCRRWSNRNRERPAASMWTSRKFYRVCVCVCVCVCVWWWCACMMHRAQNGLIRCERAAVLCWYGRSGEASISRACRRMCSAGVESTPPPPSSLCRLGNNQISRGVHSHTPLPHALFSRHPTLCRHEDVDYQTLQQGHSRTCTLAHAHANFSSYVTRTLLRGAPPSSRSRFGPSLPFSSVLAQASSGGLCHTQPSAWGSRSWPMGLSGSWCLCAAIGRARPWQSATHTRSGGTTRCGSVSYTHLTLPTIA